MKCRGNQPAMRTLLVRALSFSAVAALTLNPALTPVVASDYRAAAPVAADGQMKMRFLSLGIGKSDRRSTCRATSRMCWSPIPRSPTPSSARAQRAYIIGARGRPDQRRVLRFRGQQIAAYDIAVKRDLNGVRAALKQTLPRTSRSKASATA